jgi:hypothetical protein
MAEAIKIEGIQELMVACKRADSELKKGLQRDLKGIALLVATRAKSIAEAKGLRESGRLIASIRPGIQGSSAIVRDSANRAGFNYPAVYEYGHGKARAFLEPALEQSQPEVMAAVTVLVDRMAESF